MWFPTRDDVAVRASLTGNVQRNWARGVRRNIRQRLSLSPHRSASRLAKLLLHHSNLLDEKVDDLGLMAVGPAREGGKKELKWKEVGHGGVIVLAGTKDVSCVVAE